MTDHLDPLECLGATDVIDSADNSVVHIAEHITAGARGEVETTGALFGWVRDEIRYDMGPILTARADWTASRTIARGYGFCQQKAVLLAALLRARDIPAGFGAEELIDHKISPRYAEHMGGQTIPLHGYTVAYVDGSWQRIDASLDVSLCDRKGYQVVEYAPHTDRVLPDTDRAGQPHFVHVGELGRWTDLPDEVVDRTLALPYLQSPAFLQMAMHHGPGL